MPLVIPVFISHRGCPHLCLFCNQHAIAGNVDGSADRVDVGETIRIWLERSPGHDEVQVAFYGGSFTCLPREEQEDLLAPVQPFLVDGRVQAVRLSTRPDCLTHEKIEFLRSRGVAIVELGIQSFDNEVLCLAQRGHTAEESRRAVRLLQESGIQVGIQLLPGLPGETNRSFLAGVRETIALRPVLVRLYPVVVVEHSGLAELYRLGQYRPLSLNRAIAMTLRAKDMLDAAGIPVVRMGLQPSASLDRQVIAGPYHPAFGELVLSRRWFKEIRHRLKDLDDKLRLEIRISHRDVSALVGMQRKNIQRLEQIGFAGRFQIVAEKERKRGSIEYVVC